MNSDGKISGGISLIIRITLLITLVVNLVVTQDVDKIFEQKAIQLQMMNMFLNVYLKNNLPTEEEVNAGSNAYTNLVDSKVTGKGWSGIIQDVPVENLLKIVQQKLNLDLISKSEFDEQQRILNSNQMEKTIREHIHVRDNGQIVYGLTGIIHLGKSTKTASLIYTFYKVKLITSKPIVESSRNTNTESCKLWGILCETKFNIKSEEREFSEEENKDLANYLRNKSIQQCTEDSGPTVEYIKSQAERYKPFLPSDVKKALNDIEGSPEKRPDEILDKDPLNGNNFDM